MRWIAAWTGMIGEGEWGQESLLTEEARESEYYDPDTDTYWSLPIFDTREEAARHMLNNLSEEQREECRAYLEGFREWERKWRAG